MENETLVQAALARLIQNKTVPVIACRMRRVAADRIIKIEDGLVAEQGTPAERVGKKDLSSHGCLPGGKAEVGFAGVMFHGRKKTTGC